MKRLSNIRGWLTGIVAILSIHSVLAQVPLDLAEKKDFRAFRSSSTDPNLHNGDARHMNPGETLTVADVKGSGCFTHLWFTIAAKDQDHLREMVLRITWDDAKKPAVECPMGDFFAQGPGKYVEYHSAPVSVGGSMALNCYWPMPFKKHAVAPPSSPSPMKEKAKSTLFTTIWTID